MSRGRNLVAAVVVLLMVVGPIGPSAAEGSTFSLSGGDTDGDAGWVAVKISVAEGVLAEDWFNLHLVFDGFHGPWLGRSVIYDAEGNWLEQETLWRYGPNDEVTYVHHEAPLVPPMDDFEWSRNDSLPGGYEGGFIIGQPGTWTLVMWAAGGLDRWEWTATAGEGVEVLGFESGDRTIQYSPWDFTGTVSVVRSTSYYQDLDVNYLFLNPLVAAHVQATATLAVQDSFHGVFLAPTPGSGAGLLSVSSAASERQCYVLDCWFDATTSTTPMLPAGDYVFNYSGASVSGWGRFPVCVLCRGGPFLMGADVRIPA